MATDNTRRLAGVVTASVDGVYYPCTEFAYSCSTATREIQGSLGSGNDGYKETLVTGSAKMTIRLNGGTKQSTFDNITNSTIIASAANGIQVSGYNMCRTERVEVNAAEGTCEVTLEGTVSES